MSWENVVSFKLPAGRGQKKNKFKSYLLHSTDINSQWSEVLVLS